MAFNLSDDLPDYMYAADVHNIANGHPSIIPAADDSSTLDALTKGSLSVIARAVTSTINTIPAATNWLGLTDVPEWQTEDLLKNFDDDLAVYYSEHRDTVDLVGDVAASFVPGMAGIKALNYAQVGLKGLSRGSAGKNILQSIGALPDATDKYAKLARAKMFDQGNTFNMIESNVLKSFGSTYAQNALEFAAFETAAATAMGDFSPLFKEHTASDILYNAALGGGVIGAGLMGTVGAVQTYGALKRARDVVDKALNPLRAVKEVEESLPDFAKMLNLKGQLDNPPVFDAAAGVAESVAARTLERRQRDLGLGVQEIATRMAGGDAELGKVLAMSIRELPADAAWAATLHMEEIARVGTFTKIETKLAAAETARRTLADTTLTAGMKHQQITGLQKTAAMGEVNAVKYLHIAGEDIGKVTITPPHAIGLADSYGSAELSERIRTLVGKDVLPGSEWSPMGKSIEQIEARYIVAAERKLDEGVQIASTDLPFLEAAYSKGLNRVVVDGLEMDGTQLLRHIKETKKDFLQVQLADALIDPAASTAKIAKSLNVKQSLVEGGTSVTDDGYFAVANAAELRNPTVVKIAYKGDPETVGVTGDVLSGMAVIKELQAVAQADNAITVASVIGRENAAMLPKLADVDVLAATSGGAGAGLLTFAAGTYQSLASKVEWMGKVTNRLKTEGQKVINETLQPHMYKILNNQVAGEELAVVRQKIISSGEKYVLNDAGEIVHRDIARYEAKLAAGETKGLVRPQLAAGIEERVKYESQDLTKFFESWVNLNDEFMGKQRMLKNAIGKDVGSFGRELYFPQPDTRKFKFFSMVVPKNPAEGEKVQMLWAATAEDLANLESKVPADYSVLRKADTDRYHKAIRDYDYELGFSGQQMRADMQRSGAAAPFFPKTDPQTLLQEMLDWRHRMSDMQVRDAVTLHNQVQFSELRRLDADYTALQKSTKGKEAKIDSPFSSYVSTALDIPRASHVPVWTEFNNMAENVYSSLYNKAKDAFAGLKGEPQVERLNKVLDEGGIRGFRDAYTELFANHPAGGRELSQHVMAANGTLSTLLLRTDPMNALNNGIGSMILTGAETSSLIKSIKTMGGEFADELLQKAYVGVPGSTRQALSPIKLIGSAYEDYFKLLAKDKDVAKLGEKFDKAGFLPSMMDQIRSVMDHATLSGIEKAGDLKTKTAGMLSGLGDLLEKVTLNKSVEEMNRFVSAHIAESISGIAVRGGKMSEAEQLAFINTFVNRTQGNYLASQRPLMFQGPVGHAISLFQTYSFNMMQHVFRRVESGDKKQLALLLGLQTSVYGMNGLPAFDFMNKHLVGMAAGNISNADLYSTVQDTGGDVGKWLLYGSLSTAMGLGLYSRGDLNPRHLSILPSSVGDIPFVSATRNALGSLVTAGQEIAAGADVGSTFLRGLEHANISRPLAGLATTLQGLGNEEGKGYTTTGKNGMITAWDMYSLQSVGRILGARPMDEAMARDAYYRVQVYDSHRQAQTAIVGSAIRDKVRSGAEISESDVNGFLTEYVHKGGTQKDFIKFYQSNVKKANVSQINQLVSNTKNPYAQYMQSMMHGAELEDMAQ